MELVLLFDGELRYTSLEPIAYEPGGQIYGTMEGEIRGEGLRGSLHLTNLAEMRPDNVNCPTLRGLLTTEDGAKVFVELDGLANLRPSDNARVFVTALRFRTGDERYRWLNGFVGLTEGILDRVAVGGVARIRGYRCDATIEDVTP
jgi:hypothetical protein